MARVRVGFAVAALIMAAIAVPTVSLVGGGVAAAAPPTCVLPPASGGVITLTGEL